MKTKLDNIIKVEADKIESILSNVEVDIAFSRTLNLDSAVSLKKYIREKLGKKYEYQLLGSTLPINDSQSTGNYHLRVLRKN